MASYGDLQFVTQKKQTSVKGLEWPVRTSNTGGMFSRNFNETAVRQSLIQLLLTERGERPMRLDFGTTLRSSVFSPLDSQTVSTLRSSIQTAIDRYEPRVKIRTLELTPNQAESSLDVSLVFSLRENLFSTDGIYLTINTQGAQING